MSEALKELNKALGEILDQNPEIREKLRREERERIEKTKSVAAILLKFGDDLVKALLGEK